MKRITMVETTYTLTAAELADAIEAKIIRETGGAPGGEFVKWWRDGEGCLAVTFRGHS